MPAKLKTRQRKSNSILYILAKSKGVIPVAVQNIINPHFPQKFHLTSSDILMPDLVSSHLYLEARFTSSGNLKKSEKGDISGILKKPVFINSSGITITLSKVK